jgi:hypothetical protein
MFSPFGRLFHLQAEISLDRYFYRTSLHNCAYIEITAAQAPLIQPEASDAGNLLP